MSEFNVLGIKLPAENVAVVQFTLDDQTHEMTIDYSTPGEARTSCDTLTRDLDFFESVLIYSEAEQAIENFAWWK